MIRRLIIYGFIIGLVILSSCSKLAGDQRVQAIGLLTDSSLQEAEENIQEYLELASVGDRYGIEVYHKQGMHTRIEIMNAVEELVQKGTNLIFGNSAIYGRYFLEASEEYNDVHFVYFNGGYVNDQVTSLTFNSHAMAFFSGIIASEMSKTNHVGIIAAHEWQSEIEGFYEGAKYNDPATVVYINFLNNIYNEEVIMEMYEQMKGKQVDVFYPAGNMFNQLLIEQTNQDDLYAIGYLTNEADIDDNASGVLTNTIHNLNRVYDMVITNFNNYSLNGGVSILDFQDEMISMEGFSEEVPEELIKEISDFIEHYKTTNLLPNEQE